MLPHNMYLILTISIWWVPPLTLGTVAPSASLPWWRRRRSYIEEALARNSADNVIYASMECNGDLIYYTKFNHMRLT